MSSALRLAELAELVGGRTSGDADLRVEGLATLETAGPNDLSFVIPTYLDQVAASRAGALLVAPAHEHLERNLLISDDPRLALARLIDHFHPEAEAPPAGVHPTAIVEEGASVDESATVGPYCVVGGGSVVGARARLGAHVVIGSDCHVGDDCVLHPNVVVYDATRLGERVVLHSGVVVGSDGYGYASTADGHTKLRHLGTVEIEPDVEVGANCAIDRALLHETRIGAGSKIDNLVQVGHNARIGKNCLLVSQVGVSGSTRLGEGVVMAGQSGVAGHLELGKGSRVAAKSAVFKDVPAGETVAGIPATEAGSWKRAQALLRRLDDLRRRLVAVEKRIGRDE